MSTNIVYLIGDRNNGKIFDPNNDHFTSNIGFNCFFPSSWIAEKIRNEELFDNSGSIYTIVEAEVVKFDNGEIEISYEPFNMSSPF